MSLCYCCWHNLLLAGVITMQNPFDMYSIADIIYTVKPDLIIETGKLNSKPSTGHCQGAGQMLNMPT